MHRIDGDDVEPLVRRIIEKTGASSDAAGQVSRSLVLASLRGHNSHGVRRAMAYYEWSQDSSYETFPVDASATPSVESGDGSIAVVDGQNAFGQVVGRVATSEAVSRAEQNGIGAVGVRDATHLGRIGEWAERATAAGMLFLAFVNTQGGTWIAPPGSAQRRYSTNPVSFGVPTFDALPFPVVLDIATSQVANGKIKELASKEGSPDPEWTVDVGGGSVGEADAYLAGQGAGLPLGGRTSGYKGFGLAMISELFAAIAGDGRTVSQAGDKRYGNAALFVALDPLAFTTKERLQDRLTSLHEYIRSTDFDPAISPGVAAYGDEAYLPGEPEHLLERDRESDGIPLPERDIEGLVDLADRLDVSDAVPSAFESFR
jgi:uncharacterized oxidoreductase